MFTFHSQQPTQGFARLVPPLMSEKRLPHWLRNSTQNGTGKRNFPAIRKLPAAKFSSVVKAIENLTFDGVLLVTRMDENALDGWVLLRILRDGLFFHGIGGCGFREHNRGGPDLRVYFGLEYDFDLRFKK